MKSESFHPRLTPSFIARALGLSLPALTGLPAYAAVVTDSRKIVPGCLFVALKGEKFDGHDYIPQAIERGARGILCRKDRVVPPTAQLRVFAVDDTQAAYRRLGAAWRKEFTIPVALVAGSAGKTTTKELLAAMLRGRFPRVLKTEGSQNGFVGIPLTLLELRAEHQAAVIEVGIDEIGAMEQHLPVVHPGFAVLTSIGPEHLEQLRDVPTVAREEGLALVWTAQNSGTVAINLDDPWIRPFAGSLRQGRKIGYTLAGAGVGPGPGYELLRGELAKDGARMRFQGLGLEGLELALPLLGRHNAANLLAAVAVARAMGLEGEEIRHGLESFAGADGRSQIRELPGGTRALCDWYNAQPLSVEAGLELLTQIASGRPRWACLGDMKELGPGEEGFHRGLAPKIIALGIEELLLHGPRMQWLADELQARGFRGHVAHFETHAAMAEDLLSRFRPGDALMIKGSRSMRMEEVWKILEPQARARWGRS